MSLNNSLTQTKQENLSLLTELESLKSDCNTESRENEIMKNRLNEMAIEYQLYQEKVIVEVITK